MAPFTDLSSKRLAPRYRRGSPQHSFKLSRQRPKHETGARRGPSPPGVAPVLTILFAEIFSKVAVFPRRCLPLATHLVPTLERHAPEPMKHSNPSWRFRCRLRLFRHQPCRAACLHRVKLAPGLSGDATLLGRFLNRKLVRSVPHSKGYFRSRGLLFFMAQLRKERG